MPANESEISNRQGQDEFYQDYLQSKSKKGKTITSGLNSTESTYLNTLTEYNSNLDPNNKSTKGLLNA